MYKLVILISLLCLSPTLAEAKHHVTHRHVHHHTRSGHHLRLHRHVHHPRVLPSFGRTSTSLVAVQTPAGRIVVNSVAAPKFQGFIRDVVAIGFRGPVSCYSPTGHMRHSLHHSGRACDFAQRARNRTSHVMYHVRHLAERWGLVDGCIWRHPDCGHIEFH